MLTYQVKITVNASVEAEWLQWMKTKHVPDVIATGLIRSFHILMPEETPQTYLFQYHFASKDDYERYSQEYAPKLREELIEKFGGQFEGERSLLVWV